PLSRNLRRHAPIKIWSKALLERTSIAHEIVKLNADFVTVVGDRVIFAITRISEAPAGIVETCCETVGLQFHTLWHMLRPKPHRLAKEGGGKGAGEGVRRREKSFGPGAHEGNGRDIRGGHGHFQPRLKTENRPRRDDRRNARSGTYP